jgi:putative DNA primase/helicase
VNDHSTPLSPGDTSTEASDQGADRLVKGQTKYAEAFVRLRKNKFRYIYGSSGWHMWDGYRWVECLKDEARESLKQLLISLLTVAAKKDQQSDMKELTSMMSAKSQAGILSIAQHSPEIARSMSEMDIDPWQLNTRSGMVDLMTGQLRPTTPDDDVTLVSEAAFDSTATTPRWSAFLDQVLPDKAVQKYLQQYVGISLLGTVREHILGIATGTGANGKSTMVEALGFALGDYSHTAEQELLLGTRRESGRANPALFALRGTRFVVTSETKEGVELNTAVMKNVTGGDKITTRDLYSSSVTFEPTWTILIVTNYLPDVSASDDAAWRRIRVIPFDVVVPLEDRDPTLGDKLRLEADGILTWAVEGFQQYLRNGYRMNTPPQVELATSRYRDDSDDVSKFLHARAELSPNNLATRSEIWTAWQTWAKDESATIGKQSDLYKALELRGCRAAMPRIDGKQARSYYGIKILPDDAQIDTDDTIIDSIEQE